MNNKHTITLKTIDNVKKFINEVTKFESNIDILSGRYICDAKSIMGIFSFDLTKPVDVLIHSDDENELMKFEEVMKAFKG